MAPGADAPARPEITPRLRRNVASAHEGLPIQHAPPECDARSEDFIPHGGHMRFANVARLLSAGSLVVMLGGVALADHHTVKVASNAKLGSYLTDAKGMALYTFKPDSPGKSTCAGNCVVNWPLYFREKVGVSGSLKEGDFATITREDGQKQTTYKGMPLYYFAGDKAASDVNGHGAKNVWFLAKP
jgi:predicted lipoprotein with Yx(FWY)xxD motif